MQVMDTLFPASDLKAPLLQVILTELASLRCERRRAAKIVLRVMGSLQSGELERAELTSLLIGILSNDHQLNELPALLYRFCGASAEYAGVIIDSLLKAIHVERDTSITALYVGILSAVNGLTPQLAENLLELLGNRTRTAKGLLLDSEFYKSMEPILRNTVEAIERGEEYGSIVMRRPILSEEIVELPFLDCSPNNMISINAAKSLFLLLSCGLSTDLCTRSVPILLAVISGCPSEKLNMLEPAIVPILSLNCGGAFSILYALPHHRLLSILNDFLLLASDDFLLDFSGRISIEHDANSIRQIVNDSGISDLSLLCTSLGAFESNHFTDVLKQLLTPPPAKVRIEQSESDVAMEIEGDSSRAFSEETVTDFTWDSLEIVAARVLDDARLQHVNGVALLFKLIKRADCHNKGVLAVVVTRCCLDMGFGDQLIDYLHHNDQGPPLERSIMHAIFNTLYEAENTLLSKFISRSLSRIDTQNVQLNFIFSYGACRVLFQRRFSAWRELLGSLLDFLLIVEGDFDDSDLEFLAPSTRSDLANEVPVVLVRIISAGDILITIVECFKWLSRS